MLYQGRKFTDLGNFSYQLEPEEHMHLVYQLHSATWPEFKKIYRSGYSDLPSTVLRYSEVQGDTFEVDMELEAAPEQLKKIVLEIDSVRKATDWHATTNS
jgi:hypothetical protein